MIITCPSCSTRYEVKAAGFSPAGRKVRCAKCGHSWQQEPAEQETDQASDQDVQWDDAPPPPPPADDPAPDDDDPESGAPETERKRRMPMHAGGNGLLKAAGWIVLMAFVAGSAVGVATYKSEIIAYWPATQALYAAFNEPSVSQDMAFRNVRYEYQFEDGLPVLSIRGEIINQGEARLTLKPVQVDLRGEDRERLYHWTFRLPETALEPEESAEFVTRLSSPPLEARDLVIRFAEDQETTGSTGSIRADGQGGMAP